MKHIFYFCSLLLVFCSLSVARAQTFTALLGVASTLRRAKSKAPALQEGFSSCKAGALLLTRRSEDATPSGGFGCRITALLCVLTVAIAARAQTFTAQNHSSFDLSLTWNVGEGFRNSTRLLFGLLLPEGWRVADKGDFAIAFSNNTAKDGQFAFCQFYSDYLAKNLETPAGYYWWGGRAFDKLPFNSRLSFDADFSLTVFTDGKTGAFDLKFATGEDPSNTINPRFVSEPFSVEVAYANEFPAPREYNWQAIEGDFNTRYYSDKDFDGYFLRYYGWNGGDVGMSTLLPDGRSIWTWGDYDVGVVNSERTRLNELWQFPRNGITVQDGLDFSAFRLLTDNKLGQIKPAVVYRDDNGQEVDGGQHWYWPMGGHIFYRDGKPELQILLEHTRNAGGGQWGMEGVGVDVAVFSLPGMQLQRVAKNRYVGKVGFGNVAFRDDDGVVYIYGERNFGICVAASYVARNTGGDLTGEWEFYDAKTQNWTTEHAWAEIDAGSWWEEEHQLLNHSLFVFKDGGKYFAFEQEPCFSPHSYVYDAASPVGPFTNRRRVGTLSAEITAAPYICYIPALHPQFSVNGELLYSVSKNVNGDADRFAPGSGNIYLPYFFRVKHWRDKLNIVPDDVTSGDGSFSAQFPETLQHIGDKDENTVYSVATGDGKAWIQYDAGQTLFLRRYTLTSAPDSPGSDPLHWQILGSPDGISWTVLDERYHAAFDERGQTNAYTVRVDRVCRYFRLNVLAVNGSQELKIAEWQLFGQYADWDNTAIEKVETGGIKVYPNPVVDKLTVESGAFPVDKVSIYDISGRKIADIRLISGKFADVSALPAGMYLLKIETGAGNETVKFNKK